MLHGQPARGQPHQPLGQPAQPHIQAPPTEPAQAVGSASGAAQPSDPDEIRRRRVCCFICYFLCVLVLFWFGLVWFSFFDIILDF